MSEIEDDAEDGVGMSRANASRTMGGVWPSQIPHETRLCEIPATPNQVHHVQQQGRLHGACPGISSGGASISTSGVWAARRLNRIQRSNMDIIRSILDFDEDYLWEVRPEFARMEELERAEDEGRRTRLR